MEHEFLIAWISDDTEIPLVWADETPEYIMDECMNRDGRAGRGRLWIAEEFQQITTTWPKNSLTEALERSYGGIVIKREDLKHLLHFPIYLTTLAVEPYVTK